VLLLVMEADLDATRVLVVEVTSKQIENGVVDPPTVAGHLVVAWPRQKPPRWAMILLSDRIVVTVEKHGVGRWTKSFDAGRAKYERIEEPRRVRTMPLGRARVRHALNALIFGGELRSKRFGLRAYPLKIACKPF
jgi:hypothetical protein